MASTASPEISTKKSNVDSLHFSVASYVLSSCFPLSPSIPIFFSFLFCPPPSFLPLSSSSHFLLPFSFFLSFKKSFMLYFLFLLFSSPLLFSLVSLSLYLCSPFFFSIIYHSTSALCLPDTVVGTHYERG